MQDLNDHLMGCLRASEEKCRHASAKIESNVRDLEEEMGKSDDELINLAIEGLKQVKMFLLVFGGWT